MIRRFQGWAVMAMLACIGFGIFTTWPFLWNVLGLLWFVHLRREMKMHRTANPAPPPGREGATEEKAQVTVLGNGEGYIVYPPGHVRRHKV